MTDDLCLREVIAEDLPLFFDFQADPDANYMAAFTAKDPSDREAFAAHWKRILADPATINRTIVCNGQVVGSVASYEEAGKPEVTYWIGKAHWGKGIGTRALAAFLVQVNTARPIYARVARQISARVGCWKNVGSRSSASRRGLPMLEARISTNC